MENPYAEWSQGELLARLQDPTIAPADRALVQNQLTVLNIEQAAELRRQNDSINAALQVNTELMQQIQAQRTEIQAAEMDRDVQRAVRIDMAKQSLKAPADDKKIALNLLDLTEGRRIAVFVEWTSRVFELLSGREHSPNQELFVKDSLDPDDIATVDVIRHLHETTPTDPARKTRWADIHEMLFAYYRALFPGNTAVYELHALLKGMRVHAGWEKPSFEHPKTTTELATHILIVMRFINNTHDTVPNGTVLTIRASLPAKTRSMLDEEEKTAQNFDLFADYNDLLVRLRRADQQHTAEAKQNGDNFTTKNKGNQPDKASTRGRGRERGRGGRGDGRGRGRGGKDADSTNNRCDPATLARMADSDGNVRFCSTCMQPGHTPDKCFSTHPELKRSYEKFKEDRAAARKGNGNGSRGKNKGTQPKNDRAAGKTGPRHALNAADAAEETAPMELDADALQGLADAAATISSSLETLQQK